MRKENPMPKLRMLIDMKLERIEIDMDQCPAEWKYMIQYELEDAGYRSLDPAGSIVTYIKKKAPRGAKKCHPYDTIGRKEMQ